MTLPPLRYPAELPITARRADILAALRDHQVLIVAGETGSGKSTQLPKLCLEAGLGRNGLIGHTQPRRLAARAIAERVAEELGSPVGETVGYAVRFTDRVGERTLVKVMTDGILLAELPRDRRLARYEAIIVDEAHERSLNIDFILGYLKGLLPRRPDLKVIVTSATIDTERFSRHFDDAPVIEVSGRTYPVEVRYRPLSPEADGDEAERTDAEDAGTERDQTQAICEAVSELGREGPGDVLVFLSGEREIRDTAEALRALDVPDTEILPLYARLSAAEQHRVFQAHAGRRLVLATNVAETSLTVPGIRYVIDPGTARISRYNRRTKVQRLPIEAVSQASANQRAGRCGRVAPGVCIRLYGEDDFAARPPFTEPEILRTNLASVILQMAAIGLGDIAAFPFVEPPDARSIRDGIALLEELGALDPAHHGTRRWLTPLGRRLARLPIDPRYGRMVLEAGRFGCVREASIIAAALSIQDPRERPTGKEQAAAEQHRRFVGEGSDLLAWVALWEHVAGLQHELSSNQFRRRCKAEYLNFLRVREWQDLYSQLRQATRSLGLRTNHAPADADSIHRSLLAGLLSHIGLWDQARSDYRGARQAHFVVARGSALYRRPARWVMAAELVETNRLWARGVARIRPEWAEEAGEHLVKRSYGEPQWDPRRGGAVAAERVSLYGLPIEAGRPVGYDKVDRAAARDLFIHYALVEGDWPNHHRVLQRNRRTAAEAQALHDRARRGGLLAATDVLADVYAARIPDEVTSGRDFDRWWKRTRAADPHLLDVSLAELQAALGGGDEGSGAGPLDPTDYPDSWPLGDVGLPLSYRFRPGTDEDGVTVEVPLGVLNQLDPDLFEWQVPGLRQDLVTALIRALPKALRRNFVPATEVAAEFLATTSPGEGPLRDVLARFLARRAGEPVPSDSWPLDRLPDHLTMTFRVVDASGKEVARGKDLAALQARLDQSVRAEISVASPVAERSGLADWTFGPLPEVVEHRQRGHAVRGHPALVDDGDSVAVRVLASEDEAAAAQWAGTRRLLRLTLPSPARTVEDELTRRARFALAHRPHESVADLVEDCLDAAVDDLLAEAGGPVRDPEAFARLQHFVRGRLGDVAVEIAGVVGGVLASVAAIRTGLAGLTVPTLRPAAADMEAQVARLVYPGFVVGAGRARLDDVARYLRGVEQRIARLPGDAARDRERMLRVQRLERDYERLLDRPVAARHPEELEELGWQLEELRVSLFAQALGTPRPVSEQRIRRSLDLLATR